MRLLRLLLLLLVSANLLLMLWNLVRQDEALRVRPEQSLAPETLTLLSEHTGILQARSVVADVETEAVCLMRGPFASADEALAVMAGSAIEFRVEQLSLAVPDRPRYRAMLAPSATLAEAREKLAVVSEAIERLGGGIDTYLVTSGALANSVSLGLFNEQSNAINVQRLLAGENIEVVVETESRTETHYWLLSADDKAVDFVDESSAAGRFYSVPAELSENLCEMIAQAE